MSQKGPIDKESPAAPPSAEQVRREQILDGLRTTVSLSARVAELIKRAGQQARCLACVEADKVPPLSNSAYALRHASDGAIRALEALRTQQDTQRLLKSVEATSKTARSQLDKAMADSLASLQRALSVLVQISELNLATCSPSQDSGPKKSDPTESGETFVELPFSTPTRALTEIVLQNQLNLDRARDLGKELDDLQDQPADSQLRPRIEEILDAATVLGLSCSAQASALVQARALQLTQDIYPGRAWNQKLVAGLLELFDSGLGSPQGTQASIEPPSLSSPLGVSRSALETTISLRRAAQARGLADQAFHAIHDLFLGEVIDQQRAEPLLRDLGSDREVGAGLGNSEEEPEAPLEKKDPGETEATPPPAITDWSDSQGHKPGSFRADLTLRASEEAFSLVYFHLIGHGRARSSGLMLATLWIVGTTSAIAEEVSQIGQQTFVLGSQISELLDQVLTASDEVVSASARTAEEARKTLDLSGRTLQTSEERADSAVYLQQQWHKPTLKAARQANQLFRKDLEAMDTLNLDAPRSDEPCFDEPRFNELSLDKRGLDEPPPIAAALPTEFDTEVLVRDAWRLAQESATTSQAVIDILIRTPELAQLASAAAHTTPDAGRLASEAVKQTTLALNEAERDLRRQDTERLLNALTYEERGEEGSERNEGSTTHVVTNRQPRWPRRDRIAREHWKRQYRDRS